MQPKKWFSFLLNRFYYRFFCRRFARGFASGGCLGSSSKPFIFREYQSPITASATSLGGPSRRQRYRCIRDIPSSLRNSTFVIPSLPRIKSISRPSIFLNNIVEPAKRPAVLLICCIVLVSMRYCSSWQRQLFIRFANRVFHGSAFRTVMIGVLFVITIFDPIPSPNPAWLFITTSF